MTSFERFLNVEVKKMLGVISSGSWKTEGRGGGRSINEGTSDCSKIVVRCGEVARKHVAD